MGEKFQMQRVLGCFLVLGVVATFHGNARAQAVEPLRVEREVGAEECPDASSLGERVTAIRGHADSPSNASYAVSFAHTADSFTATIRSGPHGESQRVLQSHGPNCAALARATAVTLALLFDSVPEEPHPAPAPAPPPPPPVKIEDPLTRPVLEKPSAGVPVDTTLSLGAGGLAFVLRPISPAFTGELGLQVKRLRVGLGVLWNPTQTFALESGRVRESLVSGTARGCLALAGSRSLHLDVCSGLFVGVASGEAVGFTVNASRSRAWLALPVELSLVDSAGPLGWELSVAALGALVHQDFEVAPLGVAYHAPRVGGMLTFRALGLLTW